MTTTPEAGMRLERELARFREALAGVPDVQDRVSLGQQFNAYDLSNDDLKAVCIGPITSRPLSLTEAPADVADLLEAALRLASTLAARAQPPVGEVEPIGWVRHDRRVTWFGAEYPVHWEPGEGFAVYAHPAEPPAPRGMEG